MADINMDAVKFGGEFAVPQYMVDDLETPRAPRAAAVPVSRWRRIARTISRKWSNARFEVGHWIAGGPCEPNEYDW